MTGPRKNSLERWVVAPRGSSHKLAAPVSLTALRQSDVLRKAPRKIRCRP